MHSIYYMMNNISSLIASLSVRELLALRQEVLMRKSNKFC